MPAARGVKRAASKSSASTASTAPKNKKKRGAAVHLEIPIAPKKRGRVFACGQGDVGQLGLGEDVIETTKFKHVTALGDKIVAICAGGMHTIALDSSGKVWSYGCNDEGALGRATAGERDEGAPRRVALPGAAVALAAGDSHSAALLADGAVYAWGSFRDSHGSMGLVVRGREGKACRAPVRVELPEPAAGLASGSDHLVILTTSGAVYTMGCGEQGQLGRLTQRSASRDARQGFSALLVPGRVTLKQGASSVWAGYHATFVLDAAQDKMYAFGLNNYGQLGITGEKRMTALYAPMECDAFTSRGGGWRSVAVGQHHSLALSAAGRLHALGRCDYGRLGLGEGATDASSLEPVPRLADKKCVSIAAGTSNSFAVTDTGEVFAWGMGSEGQLGTGGSADAAEPTLAALAAPPPLRPAAVAAGGQHTVLLVEDPNSEKEDTPEPESETAEEKTEASEEEEEQEEKKEEEEGKPRAKRQKKEQEGEVSSTSSAQPAEVTEETKPQKLNGDDNKDSAMEVDETDNQQQVQEDKKEEDKSTPETEQKMDTETEPETKPDTIDTSSQGTSDSETKSQDSQDSSKSQESASQETASQESASQEPAKITSESQDSKDVEMSEKTEVNGTEESEKVEAKTVEGLQQTLTTTA